VTHVLIFSEADMADAPPKVDLHLAAGMDVIVLTNDGAVKRGRRRWHPGRSVGEVLSKHRLHERAWNVRVNGFTVILFEDELALPTEESS
jgi:hypothetical protein